jgi:predicted dehydrogenase
MKRRRFINKTALGISGISLASYATAPLFTSCSGRTRKIELAVVGCSRKGTDLIVGSFKNMHNVSIKSVFDFDSERSRETCEIINLSLGYLPQQAPDLVSIFEDKKTDGVFIFLPEHWRATATIQACQAGKDVYVEVLPARSISEGKQMVETAKKTGQIIQCGYQLRSSPAVMSAKSYIEEGGLGQVVYVKVICLNKKQEIITGINTGIPEGFDWNSWLGPLQERPYNPEIYSRSNPEGWKTFREFTAGRLSEAACGLDLARQVMGSTGLPSSVSGYERYLSNSNRQRMPERQIITWNYETCTISCDSGEAYGYISSNYNAGAMESNLSKWLLLGNRVEVYGTNGLMYLDSGSGSWEVQGKNGEILAAENANGAGTHHVVNFIDCIRSRDLPAGTIHQGHLSTALAHLGNVACQQGNTQLVFDKESDTFIRNDKASALFISANRKKFYIV